MSRRRDVATSNSPNDVGASRSPNRSQTYTLNQSISTEELREYFECPVCLVVPRPGCPIFACPQGKFIL